MNQIVRILLVDSSPEMRKSLRDILSLEMDFDLIGEADGGEQGVALAVALRPDVILINYDMPVMNGMEATRYIKRFLPDVTVIMVSFFDDPRTIDEAFESGASGYFVKPVVEFDQLYDSIRHLHQASGSVHRVVGSAHV